MDNLPDRPGVQQVVESVDDTMMGLYGTPEYKNKVFTLPSAGSVLLYGPEMDLIGTPQFQRLAGIKQLGTSYLVYRGATHTRFDHSLGTLHHLERMVQAVLRTGQGVIPDEAHKLARVFALLHDVTHVPFGHTLEDELGLLKRHDENPGRLHRLVKRGPIKKILVNTLGSDLYREFLQTMVAKGDKAISALTYPYVSDLVGNTVCADLLDYVQRDLRACGMPVGIGERFLDSFVVTSEALREHDRNRMALQLEKRGMPRPDVESEVVKLLSYRYELAERVYFHHGKNAASVMIGRAAMAAGLIEAHEGPDPNDERFDWLSDDMLLHALTSRDVARALGLRPGRRNQADTARAETLASGVLSRQLYKIAYLGVRDDLEDAAEGLYENFRSAANRMDVEDRLARKAGLAPGDVLVHLPSPDMLLKPALVRVVTHSRRVIPMEEWDERHSGRTGAINRAHQRLWRLTVYVQPEASAEQKALVRAAAEQEFGAPSRYVLPTGLPPYLREVFDRKAGPKGWTQEDLQAVEEMAASSQAVDYADVVREMQTAITARRAATRAAARRRRPKGK